MWETEKIYYSSDIADYYRNSFFKGPDHYIDWLLQLAKKSKKDTKSERFTLVLHILYESYPLEDEEGQQQYIELFQRLADRNINCIFLTSPWDEGIDRDKFPLSAMYTFNWHNWLVYHVLLEQKANDLNAQWNPEAKKFLMLTGKPHITNSIRLLWKLSQHNLVEKSIWSLLVREGTWNKTRELVPELTDQEFKDFVHKYNRQADDAKIDYQKNTLHYFGIPYDVKIYSDCLFRVIKDTRFRTTDRPMMSEKIYTTILNRLPFIIAGDTNSLKFLKSQGFATFENYLPIPEYDCIKDPEQRLNAIVTNTKYWIDNMTEKEKIAQDVEHNYHQLIKNAKEIELEVEALCNRFLLKGLGPKDICMNYGTLFV